MDIKLHAHTPQPPLLPFLYVPRCLGTPETGFLAKEDAPVNGAQQGSLPEACKPSGARPSTFRRATHV